MTGGGPPSAHDEPPAAVPGAAGPPPDGLPAVVVTCAQCGRTADETLPWSSQATARGMEWLCPACTRDHLRSIEARLTGDWF